MGNIFSDLLQKDEEILFGGSQQHPDTSRYTEGQNAQLQRILGTLGQNPIGGPPLAPFQSSYGFLAPPLTGGQMTSLAGLENLSSQAAKVSPGARKAEE